MERRPHLQLNRVFAFCGGIDDGRKADKQGLTDAFGQAKAVALQPSSSGSDVAVIIFSW